MYWLGRLDNQIAFLIVWIPVLIFFVFSMQLTVNVQYKFLPMTGFELRTSGIGRDRSTN